MATILKEHIITRFVSYYFMANSIEEKGEYYAIRVQANGQMELKARNDPFIDHEGEYCIHVSKFDMLELHSALISLWQYAVQDAPNLLEGN